MEAGRGLACADPNLMYLDVFCNFLRYTEPKILANGTDVVWTEKQAHRWRPS
jgi:hypothetical protein